MFIVLAVGIGIDVDPEADPFEVADELADLKLLLGRDGDNDGEIDPYSRPDADPDGEMTNAQLAAFLDRISRKSTENRQPDDNTGRPPERDREDKPTRPDVNRPTDPDDTPTDPDDEPEPCTTGLRLTAGDRALFVAQLTWSTLVNIEQQGEPGRPWPPHPAVPGGTDYLVVAGSPVWPVADPAGVWYSVSDDTCVWELVSFQTRLTELLPWRSSHRSTIESADRARPAAGFATFLSRWDNLSASEQAQAQRNQPNRNIRTTCGIETAKVSVDSYDRCRWQLPAPGVWSWTARACFIGVSDETTFNECATLASGVEWFLGILDYTAGITLEHFPASRHRPVVARMVDNTAAVTAHQGADTTESTLARHPAQTG